MATSERLRALAPNTESGDNRFRMLGLMALLLTGSFLYAELSLSYQGWGIDTAWLGFMAASIYQVVSLGHWDNSRGNGASYRAGNHL